MWSATHSTAIQQSIFLCHLRYCFGNHVTIPIKCNLQDTPVPAQFGKLATGPLPSDPSVEYWTKDGAKLVEKQFDSVLKERYDDKENRAHHTFGYTSPLREDTGIDILTGGDHRAGAFRLFLKLKINSPQFKRENKNQSELGDIILNLAHIDCKKDTADILECLNNTVNQCHETLIKSKLIAIRDQN